jgi:hypothetical protein
MNPLLRRLAILRLKVRLLDGWQGICAVITLVLTVGVSVGVLDYFVHLPTLVRATALVGLLVGAAGIVYRYLVRPFGKPCDNLNLALRIEEEHPELNDALASTVQFMNMTKEEQTRLGASESMRAATVADMLERASKYDFGSILDRRAGILFGVAALCALGIAGWLGASYRAHAQTAFWRLVEPFGMHTWTQVAVFRPAPIDANDGDKEKHWEALDPKDTEKDRIAIGRPYIIKVLLTGQIPKNARVEIDAKIRADLPIAKLTPGEDGQSAFFVTPINMTQQYQKFKFRVVANDGSFPPRAGAWHEVEVMHKPKLIDLDGKPSPQITIYPPAYTDLPSPVKLLAGTRHMEVYAGSRAVYRARADRPLTQALIRWQPEDPTILELAQIGAGAAVWDKAVATLEEDKSVFSIPLIPCASGKYVLYMRDKYGLESEEVADIRVVKDPEPIVKLLKPAVSAEFAPDAVVPFKFFVTDEKFAVKSVYVEFRRKALDGTPLDDNPTRTVLYESQSQGKLIPWQLAQALGFAPLTPELRLRQTKLSFDMAWALKNHQFKEGQLIVVEVFADDYCDIYQTRAPGKSQAIELRIVSKREILAEAERKLGEIQKDLTKAAKLEQKALDTVKEIRNEDKIDQGIKDKLIDGADQPQKEVRDIVGTKPTEGIRGDLNKLRETLKANNLENTKPFQEAGKIKGALDNIAQEELPQIEPKINEIRTDLNQSDKNSPKTKAKLDETAKLQQNVANTLNELIAKMDPAAKMREQRIELRDIIGKEQKLRDELAELKAKKAEDEIKTPEYKDVIEKEFKKKIEQKAEEQRDLGQRLDKLLKEMKAEQQQQEKLGNKDEAKKLADAIKQIEDPGLEKLLKEMKAEQQKQEKLGNKDEAKKIEEAIKQLENPETLKKTLPKELKEKEKELPLQAQMKDVAKDLKDKNDAQQKALDQQQNITQQLEKALDTLEGRNPDLAKEEIKDRKDAQKEIDKHVKELRKLEEQAKKADKIEDMQERLKKKEEIAQQLADLQDKMEKTRRQLAQLQEPQAADAVKQAIKEAEKAEKKIKQGDNADQEQQNAQDKLREAKADLKDSEEELAREMLIKIADHLKGLKERQDASLKRTEDLHPKVMKRKSWTRPLIDTLEGNIDAQKGIAEETDGLKEKLKGAVVFGGILERAKNSMDNAGTVMEGRKGEAKDRCFIEKGDGEVMDADAVKDEVEAQGDTVKHQKQAARSLTNLLDALKEEIDKKKKPQVAKNNSDKEPEKQEEGPKGGVPNQDGIPPMAQLKALKAEQIDLNERTIDFDKRNPDPDQFNDKQRLELRELEREQERLQELFQKLTAPPQKEGDQP